MPKKKLSPAAQLAAMRKRMTHKCPVCGDKFKGVEIAVYCSDKCRQKAKYDRDNT